MEVFSGSRLPLFFYAFRIMSDYDRGMTILRTIRELIYNQSSMGYWQLVVSAQLTISAMVWI